MSTSTSEQIRVVQAGLLTPQRVQQLATGIVSTFNVETGHGRLRMRGVQELIPFSDSDYHYPAEDKGGNIVAVRDLRARMEPRVDDEILFDWTRTDGQLAVRYWMLNDEYNHLRRLLRTGPQWRIRRISLSRNKSEKHGSTIWRGATLDSFIDAFPHVKEVGDFIWERKKRSKHFRCVLERTTDGRHWEEYAREALFDGTVFFSGIGNDELTREATNEVAH